MAAATTLPVVGMVGRTACRPEWGADAYFRSRRRPDGTQRGDDAMNDPVVAINVYSVPKGKEEEFLKWWHEMKETLTGVPGFTSGRLHRSLQEDARFNFINVAEWANSNYSQAYENSMPSMTSQLAQLGVETTPALFAIVSQY